MIHKTSNNNNKFILENILYMKHNVICRLYIYKEVGQTEMKNVSLYSKHKISTLKNTF